MDQSLEEWRSVVGYEGLYEVSSFGRVRRLAQTASVRCRWSGALIERSYKPLIRTPCMGRLGYAEYTLRKDGKTELQRGHQLVARAFLGPTPQGHEIRHLDHDRANNCLTNLAYGTRSDNMIDCSKAGRIKGQLLSKEQVQFARKAKKRGHATIKLLAQIWGVNKSTLQHAVSGRTWQWL